MVGDDWEKSLWWLCATSNLTMTMLLLFMYRNLSQEMGDFKVVAVKFIKKSSYNNTLIPEQDNEINIMKTLDHPCVTGL